MVLGAGGCDMTYRVALVSDADHVEVNALRLELLAAVLNLLDSVRVVAAAQATVAGDGNEEHLPRTNIAPVSCHSPTSMPGTLQHIS